MFLPVCAGDFDSNKTSQLLYDDSFEESRASSFSKENADSTLINMVSHEPLLSGRLTHRIDIVPELWTLQLSPTESHLWTYFHKAIAPTCILNPAINPYQDVILRIAAFTGTASPLFHAIMAISASQLYILGNLDFYSLSWSYRQRALRSLRLQTIKMEEGASDQAVEAQILATVMAMVFLDVCLGL